MADHTHAGIDFRYCEPDHTPTDGSDMDTFVRGLRNCGVVRSDKRNVGRDGATLYVWAPAGGYGILRDCYDDVDARLTETIGMESLDPDHRLHREDAHHVLCFHFPAETVEGGN